MVRVNSNESPSSPTDGVDQGVEWKERAVSMEMVEELCNKYNVPYIECSAKDRWNVNMIFDVAVKERLFHEAYHRSQTFMAQKDGDGTANMY